MSVRGFILVSGEVFSPPGVFSGPRVDFLQRHGYSVVFIDQRIVFELRRAMAAHRTAVEDSEVSCADEVNERS